MGIVTVLATVMRMRADKLVLFSGVDAHRRDLLVSFLLLNGALTSVALLLIPLFERLLPSAGTPMLVMAVLVSLLTSLVHMLMGVHASALQTRNIVQAQFMRSLGTTAAQVAFFFLAWGAFGLMLGTVVGLVASLLMQLATARGERLLPPLRKVSVDELKGGLRRQMPILMWGSLQGLAGALSNASPVIFAAAVYSPAMAGIYVMADRLVRIPVNLIVTTIRPYVAVHSRSPEGLPDIGFMVKLSLLLGLVALAGLVPVMAFGELIFTVLLGRDWTGTGSLAGILFWFVFFAFASLPWQAYVLSLGRARELIVIELVYLAARVGPLLAFGKAIDLRELALIVIFSHLLYNLLYILYFAVAYRRGLLWTQTPAPSDL